MDQRRGSDRSFSKVVTFFFLSIVILTHIVTINLKFSNHVEQFWRIHLSVTTFDPEIRANSGGHRW